ncbi:MAG: hypothetical protein HC824_15775 [Synechococcales cyanobacterium RM1_1_8]|nr:hypothetical protein [Synechococcales cyanobacterium RM1_1_8]
MASLKQLFALAKRSDSDVKIQILDDQAEEVAIIFTIEPTAAAFHKLVKLEWPQSRQENCAVILKLLP